MAHTPTAASTAIVMATTKITPPSAEARRAARSFARWRGAGGRPRGVDPGADQIVLVPFGAQRIGHLAGHDLPADDLHRVDHPRAAADAAGDAAAPLVRADGGERRVRVEIDVRVAVVPERR